MKAIMLLEAEDILHADDWVRPIVFHASHAQGEIKVNTTSAYGGGPLNHPKWVRAKRLFGPCWLGKKIGSLSMCSQYEFVRGDIPDHHKF